ncbi:hypothetical protein NC651_025667 [Populus alba x Populus x berolinensis]|nr:hypothetical protein NC651_025667 [Populus alba x Populus x berolinensis]
MEQRRRGFKSVEFIQALGPCFRDEGGGSPWLCTVVYVNLKLQLKRECHEETKTMGQHITLPWMVIGDFNKILTAAEKMGGTLVDMRKCLRFNRWIQDFCVMSRAIISARQ